MARRDKYYGTNTLISGDKLKKLKERGYVGTHRQFRIVCKAKSLAEANRKAETYGLSGTCFDRAYTCETGNNIEISMADIHEFIICVSGAKIGRDYISLASLNE